MGSLVRVRATLDGFAFYSVQRYVNHFFIFLYSQNISVPLLAYLKSGPIRNFKLVVLEMLLVA